MQIFKHWGIKRVNFKNFNRKHIKNVPALGRFVWAISGVGRFNGLACSCAVRKEKKKGTKRRLRTSRMSSHAPFQPIVTKFFLQVWSDNRCDHWCQVLWKSVKRFRSYKTS